MAIDRYRHACDASAAVMIAGTSFFAAASDEGSALRIYERSASAPVWTDDVAAFLELDEPDKPEIDIEGAAQIVDQIYWIGSHGRSKSGKVKKNRQRFFATTIDRGGAVVALRTTGKPYKHLLTDLTTSSVLAPFGLAAAAAIEQSPEMPSGFNIEGLAPAREPGELLIGFRNPVPQGKALIVRLTNPAALVGGMPATATLAIGGVLDLQGLGIRALEFVEGADRYLVLAGAFDDSQRFQLYEWAGRPEAPPRLLTADLADFRPEELLVVEANHHEITVQLLSDDGTDDCKAAGLEQRSFRTRTVRLQI